MRATLKVVLAAVLATLSVELQAQKYSTEKSLVTFFSDAPLEDISAKNTQGIGILDASTNQVAFSIPISGFEFERKLMQEHFNEKYMESERYPKSTFQGKLMNFDSKQKGVQQVKAKGKLTIHGVTREVEIPGTIEMTADNKIKMISTFKVKVADYEIEIPQLVFQNIAEEVEVTVDFTLIKK